MRLHEYLRRIGLAADGALPPTIETLRRLHAAHREGFLFENLTIQTGGAISVELDDIERKFVDNKRGGYCFEHNTLFAAALRELGFQPVAFLGRVRRGPPERWARTHMVLRIPVIDESSARAEMWLADVGFGAIGLVEPMRLADGATSFQRGIEYTLRKEAHLWVLSMRSESESMELYEFAEDPQTAGDVAVANHYTSTHPASVFRRTLTIQRVIGNERLTLRNETLTRYSNGRLAEEPVARERLPQIARELFGVDLPAGPFVFESYGAMQV